MGPLLCETSAVEYQGENPSAASPSVRGRGVDSLLRESWTVVSNHIDSALSGRRLCMAGSALCQCVQAFSLTCSHCIAFLCFFLLLIA